LVISSEDLIRKAGNKAGFLRNRLPCLQIQKAFFVPSHPTTNLVIYWEDLIRNAGTSLSGKMGSSFPDSKMRSAVENGFRWKVWIEMVGSEPVAIEER
jgi:hypothetical protein